MKLIIQIPCFNERAHLPGTFADLPRTIPGIDEIEVLVIDDGSSDDTTEVARQIGVHHIVRFTANSGLAAAFMAGIDAGLRLGADVIVNTDADNQYRDSDIAALVAPIVARRADLVIGDRQTDQIAHFSPLKRFLQRWGSRLVRKVASTRVADSPSGFRAISRKAAHQLFVHNRFTYTLETVIQAGRSGLAIENVSISTNPKMRESRLFKSIPDYLKRALPVIFRSYLMYRPVQTFSYLAVTLFGAGSVLFFRFLYHYVTDPSYSGYVQSLVVAVGCIILAFLVMIVAVLSELLAANRRLLEELMVRVRRLDASHSSTTDGLESTGTAPWRVRSQERVVAQKETGS